MKLTVRICENQTEPKVLNLTPRSVKALYGAKIETVGELLILIKKDLSKIRGLGPASQLEVKTKLRQYRFENNWGEMLIVSHDIMSPPQRDKV